MDPTDQFRSGSGLLESVARFPMLTTPRARLGGTPAAGIGRKLSMATSAGRKRIRKKVEIEASYKFSSKWYPCLLRDLTTEGAGLKINQIFLPGDSLRVRFGPNYEDLVVEAKVANVDGNRIGVKFFADRNTADFLLNLIRSSI